MGIAHVVCQFCQRDVLGIVKGHVVDGLADDVLVLGVHRVEHKVGVAVQHLRQPVGDVLLRAHLPQLLHIAVVGVKDELGAAAAIDGGAAQNHQQLRNAGLNGVGVGGEEENIAQQLVEEGCRCGLVATGDGGGQLPLLLHGVGSGLTAQFQLLHVFADGALLAALVLHHQQRVAAVADIHGVGTQLTGYMIKASRLDLGEIG